MAVVVITGGAGHLGRVVAQRFCDQGDEVHLVDVDESVVGIAKEMGATAHLMDATDSAAWGTLSTLPHVDQIISMVGSWPRIPWDSLEPEQWRRLVEVNLDSAYQAVKALTDGLRAARGVVVFVGSAIALKGMEEMAHYAAAKAGLHGLMMSLARILGPDGVRVNVVAPGLIETTDAENTWSEDQRRSFWAQRALKQPLDVDEVVDAVWFMAGKQSRGITGQILVVDKGLVLH